MTDTSRCVDDNPNEHVEGNVDCRTKKVRMSPELMNEMASRTIDGYRVNWEWKLENYFIGEWTPIATVDYTDRLYTLEEARLVLDK